MKENNNKGIKNLGSELQFLQLEELSNDIEDKLNKSLYKRLKGTGVILVGALVAFGGYMMFNSSIALVISASLIAGSTIVTLGKNFVEDFKIMYGKKNINEDDIYFEGLNATIEDCEDYKYERDFYTEEFKDFVDTPESEDTKKYNIALDKQRDENEYNKKYDEALENQKKERNNIFVSKSNYLSKDDTMIKIVFELDTYSSAYKIPGLLIPNEEWQLLFDVLYEFAEQKDMVNQFYELMSQLTRLTLSYSLINNEEKIDINSFVNCFHYLQKEYYYPDLDNSTITYKDIAILEENFERRLNDLEAIKRRKNIVMYTFKK